MFLSFFVLLLNIPSNVNLALWRLCASSRMANLRSVFHSFMAYATLRSVALLFGNHNFLTYLKDFSILTLRDIAMVGRAIAFLSVSFYG